MKTPLLYEKLNSETARISWEELQRYFARGVLIVIADGLDLPEIARKIADDDADSVRVLMEKNQIRQADDDDARKWQKNNQQFWAVVVAPWVLIQAA